MTNYLTKLIRYVTGRTEAQPDSDSMIGSHLEHDIEFRKEKEAERKKSLADIIRKTESILL